MKGLGEDVNAVIASCGQLRIGRRRLLGVGIAGLMAMPGRGFGLVASDHDPIRVSGGSNARSIVDVHSHPSMPLYHQLIEAFATMNSEQRFSDRIAFPPGLPLWSAGQALEAQDRHHISAQVLSLPDVTLGLRGETARQWARRINEALAEIVSDHPGRFGAFAVIPHDDMDSTLREIEYALDVLKLDGICTSTNIRGTYIGDPALDPWLAELHRRSAVLFIHPTMPTTLNPVVPPVIEFSFDTARMVMNMVLSGAKRRFSGVKVISTHGGGAIPSVSHRLEIVQPLVTQGKFSTEQIREDLRSFYYDLTSCMGAVSLGAEAAFVGSAKLLMGFDYPYGPETLISAESERFYAFGGMSEQDKVAVAHANALALFPRLASAVGVPKA